MRIEKPWGHEEIWAKTDDYVGKVIFINAGQRLSKQFHRKKEETIYVLEGVLINYDESGNSTLYYPGQSLHISPGTIHRFCAASKAHVKIMEVSTNYLDDVVRLEDDYDREEKV
jgi:mannose-6-phosphate isomerase